jgi:hypothetical protein
MLPPNKKMSSPPRKIVVTSLVTPSINVRSRSIPKIDVEKSASLMAVSTPINAKAPFT